MVMVLTVVVVVVLLLAVKGSIFDQLFSVIDHVRSSLHCPSLSLYKTTVSMVFYLSVSLRMPRTGVSSTNTTHLPHPHISTLLGMSVNGLLLWLCEIIQLVLELVRKETLLP